MRLTQSLVINSILRGIAIFLGGFTLLNIIGSKLSPGFDGNIWWIDLRPVPAPVRDLLLATLCLGLLSFGSHLSRKLVSRRIIGLMTLILLTITLWNAAAFYREWSHGEFRPGVAVPLSMLLSIPLTLISIKALRSPAPPGATSILLVVLSFLCCGLVFPLAQMFCFGETDYRRPADAIVVFGARAYADGSASPALLDRTRTAIELHYKGFARVLIFSGGPGDGPVSEPQCMRQLALAAGVSDADIVVDEQGLNTDKTVANTLKIFRERRYRIVLAVSHFYHLPRVKLTYARRVAAGDIATEIFTVPAKEGAPLPRMPFYMAREIAALWMYYFRPLAFRAAG